MHLYSLVYDCISTRSCFIIVICKVIANVFVHNCIIMFRFSEFEDAFSVFDVRGSGLIRVSAVFPLIRSLGHNPLEAKVWVFMNELDLTG